MRPKSPRRGPPPTASFLSGLLTGVALSSFLFFLSMTSKHTLRPLGQLSRSIQSRELAPTRIDDKRDGWKALHVYYGNASHAISASTIPNTAFASKQWYSQLRQDELVVQLLRGKRHGYFVDLAANDAMRYVNPVSRSRFILIWMQNIQYICSGIALWLVWFVHWTQPRLLGQSFVSQMPDSSRGSGQLHHGCGFVSLSKTSSSQGWYCWLWQSTRHIK